MLTFALVWLSLGILIGVVWALFGLAGAFNDPPERKESER